MKELKQLEEILQKTIDHLEIAIHDQEKCENGLRDLIKDDRKDKRKTIKLMKDIRIFGFQSNKYLGLANYSCSYAVRACEGLK